MARVRALAGAQKGAGGGPRHTYKGFRDLLAAARRLESRRDVLFVFAGPDMRGNARHLERAGPNYAPTGIARGHAIGQTACTNHRSRRWTSYAPMRPPPPSTRHTPMWSGWE